MQLLTQISHLAFVVAVWAHDNSSTRKLFPTSRVRSDENNIHGPYTVIVGEFDELASQHAAPKLVSI